MDKRTIIGIVLIVLITLMLPFYQKWLGVNPPVVEKKATSQSDTSRTVALQDTSKRPSAAQPEEQTAKSFDSLFTQPEVTDNIPDAPEEKIIEIENDYVKSIWSTKSGGSLLSWVLKEYDYYQGGKVNLIDQNGFNLSFLNFNGKEIKLQDYNLFTDYSGDTKIVLDDNNPEFTLTFYLPLQNGRVEKTIHFFKDKYSFDVDVTLTNLQNYIINRKYFVTWENGLPTTEENIKDDNNYTRAYAYMADELENVDAKKTEYKEESYNGRVDWVATRTKYFLVALAPWQPEKTNGAAIGGLQEKINEHTQKHFRISIDNKYSATPTSSNTYTVFLGPLDYYVLKKYNRNFEKLVMNNGWYERLFRPISLLIIPAFKFLYRFIPNYGFVIIVFSILVKLILSPLTKKSYKSMSEMQYLQPKMTELREKYKNEPQRLNKEMMKLYKEHGVNPMGGCLPMLLQMPLLFSLFIVFRSTIQLRGKPFILWITDLSRPDVLYTGMNLPLIGDNIHVLPLLMAVTMIWQSKISMTDPKQKMMVYFMPVFMAFIFYSLPSGLNLYYALFNVLSMIQTAQIKKKMHPGGEKELATAEVTRKVPPKKKTKSRKS